MTAAVLDLPRHRGRPSSAELASRVERQASIITELRLERRVLRAECRGHAAAVRAHGRRIQMLAQAGGIHPAAFQEGVALEELADRHDRQRGGGAA